MANRTVAVDLVLNAGRYQSEAVKAAAATRGIGDAATTAGTKAQRGFDMAGRGAAILGTVLAGGVAVGLKRTIDLAANAEQSIGGVQAVFKDYAKLVIADSEAADRALGLSANAYRELATIIGSQLKNAGVPMEQLAAQTDNLITMGADLAAQFGGTTEEAVRALSSALRGELDPIERYGISLNDAALKAEAAALGLEVMGGSLTVQQRAMAVMSLVTKQGADAIGAFGREQDTAAGRAARAAAQWENLQTAIGEKLLPVWSGLMDFVGSTVIPGLETVGGVLADVGGFFADNTGLALALGAALAIQLAGGIAAVNVALNRMILTPVVLGLSGLLGVVGSFPAALASASTAMAGFLAAAAPLVAVGAVVYAIAKVVDFATAAGDAREEVEDMWAAVDNAEAGDRLAVLEQTAESLRAKIAALNDELNLDEIGLFSALNGFDVAPGVKKLEEYERALLEVEAEIKTATGSIPLLGDVVAATGVDFQAAQADVDAWLETLAKVATGFVEPLSVYQGLLDEKIAKERESAEATAAATDSAEDSWEDYVGNVTVSLDEYAAKLEEQIAAQVNWQQNLGIIAQRAGTEVAQILAAMGQDGVDLVAAMANGTDAEMQRMAALLIQDARMGGEGAVAALDQQLQVMAAVGARGAAATVQGIAAQLGIGADIVRQIAAQYGINLAEGVNPLLAALGKPRVSPALNGQRMPYYADGGYTGPGGKYTPAGIVHAGEFVVPKETVDRTGPDYWYRMAGMRQYATGGFVSASDVPRPPSVDPYRVPISSGGEAVMGRAYGDTVDWVKANAAPPLSAGIGWQAMMAALRTVFPGLTLHSGFRPGSITATGNLSYHALGRAVDVPPRMDVFDWIAKNYPNSREVIYSPAGGRQIWNGRPHMYSEPTRGDHWDHVHWAMANGGVIGEPVIGRGMWSGGSYSFGEKGPETVVPGIRSREFASGGGSARGAAPVVVAIEGARISGTLMVNGLESRIDGRIDDIVFGGTSAALSDRGVRV